jgi:hypothetical protein
MTFVREDCGTWVYISESGHRVALNDPRSPIELTSDLTRLAWVADKAIEAAGQDDE